MLLETIEYLNELPFTVSFCNVAEEDVHYHNEMEMLLVLRGTTHCKIHNVNYALNEGDVLIVDSRDLHRIFGSSEDILMLAMHINLEFYTDLYPDINYMIFVCEDYGKNSALKYQDLQKKVSILKHHIAQTALACMNGHENSTLLMEYINNLIFTLVNQFQGFLIEDNQFKADSGDTNVIDLKRLYKIVKHIYMNYDKRISLDDLAEIVYLNPYYISHLIKNTSGLSFQNFLNYVRLEHAEKLLAENKLTLTQVSESCGFSSPSYFNKCFKIWYNMTPAEYRAQLSPCERSYNGNFSEAEALSLLESYLIAYHSQRNNGHLSRSSHHIFIPVKHNYRVGREFQKTFPLEILLDSDEDVFMLSYQKEKLKELKPYSVVLDYSMLSRKYNKQKIMNILFSLKASEVPVQVIGSRDGIDKQVGNIIKSLEIPLNLTASSTLLEEEDTEGHSTVCAALTDIIRHPQQRIHLSGSPKALFTPEGLVTPFYSVYSVFAQINGIITEQRDQYLIIKNRKTIYLLIFHEDKESKLKAHIHIKDIREKKFVIEKSYTKEQNCYEILKLLNHPPVIMDSLKAHINAASAGNIRFSSFDGKENYDMDFNMDFDMNPETFTFLEIR